MSTPTLILEERLEIKYCVVKLVNDFRAIVDIYWSDFGIADYGSSSVHVISVLKDGNSAIGFPKTLNGAEAFNDYGYSVRIDDWDIRSTYEISVTVNSLVTVTKTINPFSGYTPPPEKVFDPNTIKASLVNTDEGVKIKVFSSCAFCLDEVVSIVVSKKVNEGSYTEAFRNTVPFNYSLDSAYGNYLFIHKDGTKIYSNSTDFDEIYNNRSQILFYLSSSGNPYLLVSDLAEIARYREDKIISVGNLDPTSVDDRFTDTSVLYLDVTTESYYRYRDTKFSLPFQYPQKVPYAKSKWFSPSPFSTGGTPFDIFIPGYGSEAGDTFTILAALKNDRENFTEYPVYNPIISQPIENYLDLNVSFMDSRTSHVDTDVLDGSVYGYKVDVITPGGEVITVFEGNIRRFTPSRGSLAANVSLDNLEITQNSETVLNEKDFQSGVANGHMNVTLSDDPKDYALYVALKGREGLTKCQ